MKGGLFLFFGLVLLRFEGCKARFSDEWETEFSAGQQYEDTIARSLSDTLLIEEDSRWISSSVLQTLGPITAAVPLDSHGSKILVLHRADRFWDGSTFYQNNTLRHKSKGPITEGVLALIENGELVETYLKNRFYMPHGLFVDQEKNVWITDVGLHQVFKFGPNWTEPPLLTLGEAFRPGNDTGHFCKPTHVVVASNGEFFVSDGYCNSRIMKFDASGNLLKQWGHETFDFGFPGPYDLDLPHELALIEDKDMLCVADRENDRASCFIAGLTATSRNETGRFVTGFRPEERPLGKVFGIAFHPGTRLLFLLVDLEEGAEVQVFEFDRNQYLGRITVSRRGFGMAHTISTCQSQGDSGCFLVSSLSESPSDPMDHRTRGLQFYRFDDRKELLA